MTGLALLTISLLLGACANNQNAAGASPPTASGSASAPPSFAQSASSSEDYRIGAQDLLELQVFGAPDLNRTVRVNSRGLISLPLIGMVQAGGLTSEQLESSLAEKLSKQYLQSPQVSVFIKEYTSQRVTVEGAVKKPGVYPLKGKATLLQTLAIAEGLTTVANPNDIKVLRTDQQTGSRTTLIFDLEKIRIGELRDPDVRNDDIVQVSESTGKAVAKELIEFILPFRLLSPAF
ncbi:MAG: polysaccharide export protein [Candidatus Competibacteraceae bacterium]|nr:polysaccharide export protein [Candidatus Competibacteraceae bacterium]MBK7984656.1 polysaccharide export protein [Candidatus Competibacteraceae bacterium]MBK8897096.1 polysaccharide export protein [Candidatus Competibacteraceae bacterium]MBK8964578.1 polysaccharide export protein [Candidatus Competibacteraceae bacterium]MBK9952574.1 polysaccharide export protein [Candidatus Competibacteraceae bacterium]